MILARDDNLAFEAVKACCDPLTVTRLTRLRDRILSGEVHDDTIEARRLRFQRILWRAGCYALDGGPWPQRVLRLAA